MRGYLQWQIEFFFFSNVMKEGRKEKPVVLILNFSCHSYAQVPVLYSSAYIFLYFDFPLPGPRNHF